jgi:hypothetical protein
VGSRLRGSNRCLGGRGSGLHGGNRCFGGRGSGLRGGNRCLGGRGSRGSTLGRGSGGGLRRGGGGLGRSRGGGLGRGGGGSSGGRGLGRWRSLLRRGGGLGGGWRWNGCDVFVSLVMCPQGRSRLTGGLDGGEDREDDERELHFEILVLKVWKRVDEAALIF